jgi:hypothetical protein
MAATFGCVAQQNETPGDATQISPAAKESQRAKEATVTQETDSAEAATAFTGHGNDGTSATLLLRPVESTDSKGCTVEVEITNSGTVAFTWDTEFRAMTRWTLSTLDGKQFEQKTIRVLPGPDDGKAVSNRFVVLNPGETLVKQVDLGGEVAVFWSARKSIADPQGGSAEVPVAGEELVRFDVPNEEHAVRIRVEYSGTDSDVRDGFAVYFGQRPEAVGMLGSDLAGEVTVKCSSRVLKQSNE